MIARTCRIDGTMEPALRFSVHTGALNCSEWNDGREALRLGHDASLEQAGAQHSLSPGMPGRRSGDCLIMRLQGSQKPVNSQIFGKEGNRPPDIAQLPPS